MPDTGTRGLDFPSPMAAPAEPEDLGFGRLIEVLRRRIWVLSVVAALTFAVVALNTLMATRLYTAVTQIEIETGERRPLGDEIEAMFSGLPAQSSAIDTETEKLKSRALAARVVDAERLDQDPEFHAGPSWIDRLSRMVMSAEQAAAADRRARALARESAIDALLRQVEVSRLGGTFLIEVAVTSPDPGKAARLADAYGAAYLARQLDTKYEAVAQANEWMSQRLSVLRDEVRQKEEAAAAHRSRSGLLTAEGSTLAEQTIARLNADLAAARADLAERQARLRGAESGAGATTGEALASRVVQELRAQQAEVSRRRAELAVKYGPRHPEMLRIAQEERDIEQRIEDELSRTVTNLRSEVQIARRRVASLEADLTGQRGVLAQTDVGAVAQRELEREAEASRTLYEAFLGRARQLAETAGLEQADARIVTRASPPTQPSSPNVRLSLLLGLILALALGLAAVAAVEAAERSVRSAEDVRQRLGLPALAQLPHLERANLLDDGALMSPEEYVLRRPVSAFGEAVRALRAALFLADERGPHTLAVTSAAPEEGKTTTAISLARISALAGARVCLVDCDLRRRSATHALGIQTEAGLAEVLTGTAALDAVIQRDLGSGMDVIPLAQAEFSQRELFGSEAMRALLDELKRRYDVVILDTAPVLPVSDTRVLARHVDQTLLVARWGRTSVANLREAIGRLRAHGAQIAGVALQHVGAGLMSRLLYEDVDQQRELYQTYYVR